MDLIPFLLVVASAFSHASWNLLAKGSSNKLSFMWWIASTSLITVLPVFWVLLPSWNFPLAALPYLVLSGAVEALYFLSLSRAYELGDLSVVYPLARSAPLFLFILAVVFLGENLSVVGVSGILLVVAGVYTIHLQGTSSSELLKPLRSLRGRASQFALLTALWTSLYSLIDKIGVTVASPLSYALWLNVFVVAFQTPTTLWRSGWSTVAQGWKGDGVKILAAGFLMRFGYVLVLLAMSLTQVSYTLAVRQLSIVIGVVMGVVLLGEKYGRIRLLGSIIIFAGVLVIGAFA